MEPWEFVVVALGAFRLWRIAARDTITEKAREAVTGYDDDEAPPLKAAESSRPPSTIEDENRYGSWRVSVYLSALIRCPWCLGFYVSVGTYVAWRLWPDATIVAATVLALSTLLGLLGKLDRLLG